MGLPLIVAADDEKEILDNDVEFLSEDFQVLGVQTPETFLQGLPHFYKNSPLLIKETCREVRKIAPQLRELLVDGS